jgi:hypothetical protein
VVAAVGLRSLLHLGQAAEVVAATGDTGQRVRSFRDSGAANRAAVVIYATTGPYDFSRTEILRGLFLTIQAEAEVEVAVGPLLAALEASVLPIPLS